MPCRNLLAKGISTEVELQSGLVVRYGAPERRAEIAGFRWQQVDAKDFVTDGTTWDDYTDDPTAGDRQDLIMIGHGGIWRPGMPSPEADGRLLNVKTGRFRRVPLRRRNVPARLLYEGPVASGRHGLRSASGVMGLYEIDLKTGANRQLGGDLLASGFSLFPSLSPDGKTGGGSSPRCDRSSACWNSTRVLWT